MAAKQLSFLEKIVEDPILVQVLDVKEKQENLRRGIFQRYDHLQKEIEGLKAQLQEIRSPTVFQMGYK